MNARHTALLALCAGIAPLSVQAVTLNPRGIGEALIYPYYTVNAGQDTLITVNNVSDVGKATRVFVREGYNGRAVLDFTVFLSAHDVWTGAIFSAGPTDRARIMTTDHSCLLGWTSNPQAFSTSEFDGEQTNDSGPHTPDRTREGMIEFIVGGDIVPGSALDSAITHVQDGTPNGGRPNCTGIDENLYGTGQLRAPTEGLTGSAAIINVGEGTFYPYNADELAGFSDRVLYTTASPWTGLQVANTADATHGVASATIFSNSGKPLTLDYARGEDAVSAVFMADTLYNDYLENDALGAHSAWVMTFPTKLYYTDKQRYPGTAVAPFEEAFASGRSRVNNAVVAHDQESGTWNPHCAEPLPEFCSPPYLSFLVTVIPVVGSYTAPNVLGSSQLDGMMLSAASSGRFDFSLDEPLNSHVLSGGRTSDGSIVDINGLPVTGFMVYNVINANAQPGRLANYSGLFPHRSTLLCTDAAHPAGNVCP